MKGEDEDFCRLLARIAGEEENSAVPKQGESGHRQPPS
jgi:hypothetical protein